MTRISLEVCIPARLSPLNRRSRFCCSKHTTFRTRCLYVQRRSNVETTKKRVISSTRSMTVKVYSPAKLERWSPDRMPGSARELLQHTAARAATRVMCGDQIRVTTLEHPRASIGCRGPNGAQYRD